MNWVVKGEGLGVKGKGGRGKGGVSLVFTLHTAGGRP